MTEAATTKTMNIKHLDNAAEKAGMTVAEFTELALYWMLEMCESAPGFATTNGQGFLHSSREKLGSFPPLAICISIAGDDSIVGPELEKIGKSVGLSKEEIPGFCILWMMRMATDNPHYAREAAKEWKESKKDESLVDIPHTKHPLHPFMQRLFSGDLKAVHGPTFGDLCGTDVGSEHHFLEQNIIRAFRQNTWDESIGELIGIESVIRDCPKLQNEAAAIRALVEAGDVLGDFCRAVNAT